jgi:hypothetical protein
MATLIDVIAVAARVLRHRSQARAPPPQGEAALAEAAAAEAAARTRVARVMRRLRTQMGEAVTQALDLHEASALDSATLLAVAGEAVADVSIERSDLIRAMLVLLYETSLDNLLNGSNGPTVRRYGTPTRVFVTVFPATSQ